MQAMQSFRERFNVDFFFQSWNGKAVFFEEADVYREPASSTDEIYQQLSNCKAREIIRKYIT